MVDILFSKSRWESFEILILILDDNTIEVLLVFMRHKVHLVGFHRVLEWCLDLLLDCLLAQA